MKLRLSALVKEHVNAAAADDDDDNDASCGVDATFYGSWSNISTALLTEESYRLVLYHALHTTAAYIPLD